MSKSMETVLWRSSFLMYYRDLLGKGPDDARQTEVVPRSPTSPPKLDDGTTKGICLRGMPG